MDFLPSHNLAIELTVQKDVKLFVALMACTLSNNRRKPVASEVEFVQVDL